MSLRLHLSGGSLRLAMPFGPLENWGTLVPYPRKPFSSSSFPLSSLVFLAPFSSQGVVHISHCFKVEAHVSLSLCPQGVPASLGLNFSPFPEVTCYVPHVTMKQSRGMCSFILSQHLSNSVARHVRSSTLNERTVAVILLDPLSLFLSDTKKHGVIMGCKF